MKLTLCGSARFEKEFKEWNKRLSLAGHIVYSLAVYPSDAGGKDWYSKGEKETLDVVHLGKIGNSDAIVVVNPGGYTGESTQREIQFAKNQRKRIFCTDHPLANFANESAWNIVEPEADHPDV